MKRRIIQTRSFTKSIDTLIKKGRVLKQDFDSFKRSLTENPKTGDVISATGGIRKIRLKSASGGKSGGFRICYYDLEAKERLYLLLIYAKNEKENITKEEKKMLKELVHILRGQTDEK